MFLYLVDEDGQCVSYKKFNSSSFKDESNEWRFEHMIVDESVGQIKKKRNGGIIQFRCFIRKVERVSGTAILPPFTWTASVDWKPVPMKVRAYIYQCKDLPSGDEDGLSDPFIKIWDKLREVPETKVIQDTLNPIFYEVKTF